MTSMFERRELVRNVHIESRYLQRNIHTALLAQLKHKFEGVCVPEGYIQRQSITIVSSSMGRLNLLKGGIDYSVRFQADVCFPHPGQTLKAPVVVKSKIGLHLEQTPLRVLLPRDLHIGNEGFENVQEKQEVEFEVVGAKFQQGDDHIVVLGKLKDIVAQAPADAPVVEPEEEIQAPADPSSEKRFVTIPAPTSDVPRPTGKKRVTLKTKDASAKEGTTGTAEGSTGETGST